MSVVNEITLKSVVLRPWNENDISSLVFHANNKDIAKFLTLSFPHPYTETDGQNWINYCSSLTEKTQLAIVYNNQAIGNIGITINRDIYSKTGEVGYWIGEEFWNLGITTEVLNGFKEYCHSVFELNRIYARVFESNIGSRKVLEKSGFIFKCTLDKEIYRDGKVFNALLFDIIF